MFNSLLERVAVPFTHVALTLPNEHTSPCRHQQRPGAGRSWPMRNCEARPSQGLAPWQLAPTATTPCIAASLAAEHSHVPQLGRMAPRACRCHHCSERVQDDAAQMLQPSGSSHGNRETMEIKSAQEFNYSLLERATVCPLLTSHWHCLTSPLRPVAINRGQDPAGHGPCATAKLAPLKVWL